MSRRKIFQCVCQVSSQSIADLYPKKVWWVQLHQQLRGQNKSVEMRLIELIELSDTFYTCFSCLYLCGAKYLF